MTGIKRILARFGFVYRAASFCYQALRRAAGWLEAGPGAKRDDPMGISPGR